MKIAVVGAGYVGLVSGACFADFGHDVICVDLDAAKVAALQNGDIPIFEPGLDQLVAENASAGRIKFTTDLELAVAGAEVVFLAVGTPSRRGDGHADLSYVYAAVRSIAGAIRDYTVIVTKSTVPVGTGDEIDRIVRAANPSAVFSVVSNPEFLREGAAIDDFKRPDRIVIGVEDAQSKDVMQRVYSPLHLNQGPLIFMTRRAAEITKYAANAFLAMKITFINEIADFCERADADVQQVARGIGLDNRIGTKFLNAGPGYGGSCFPKDTLALIKSGQDFGSPMRLVETTVSINEARKLAMGAKVIAACGGSVRGKRIAILGLTFKPNTDDIRDAPSLTIAQTLHEAGASLVAYDPEGMEATKAVLDYIELADNPYAAAENADAIVLVTEWNAFRALDLGRLRNFVKTPILIDLRNVYSRGDVEAFGFSYHGIGKPMHSNSSDLASNNMENQL